ESIAPVGPLAAGSSLGGSVLSANFRIPPRLGWAAAAKGFRLRSMEVAVTAPTPVKAAMRRIWRRLSPSRDRGDILNILLLQPSPLLRFFFALLSGILRPPREIRG